MGVIHTLDLQTANGIAAGEVVERPASVVKELCENAMDAGATSITVEIRNGGISSIRVTDNGRGMDHEDAAAAFGRHATSKLRTLEDLEAIGTMGFRGEALATIAAVSRVTLRTRVAGGQTGTRVRIEGGLLVEHSLDGCPEGTSIEVESLFYNTPARFKFLKKDATESGYIGDVIERLALARPDLSIRFVSNGQEQLRTPGNNDLRSAVYTVFGKQTANQNLQIEHRHDSLLLSGFAGLPENARSNRSRQILHVNGRAIQSRIFAAAIDEAYRNRLMKGKHPFVLLRLEIPPNLVDVNVHPQKREVRFWNDNEVFLAMAHALKAALEAYTPWGENGQTAPPDDPGEANSAQPAKQQPESYEVTALPLSLLAEDKEGASGEKSWTQTALPEAAKQALAQMATDGGAQMPDAAAFSKTTDPTTISATIHSLLDPLRYVGIAFGTYVMMEERDDLVLMDQHAAHERILFERLLDRAKGDTIQAQPLLVPAAMDITTREAQILEESRAVIESAGFQYDFLGPRAIALRAIPGQEDELRAIDAMRALLDDWPGQWDSGEADVRTAMLAAIACKAAVKAGDRLDESGVRALLLDLSVLRNPYQCPHGRPIFDRISRTELEKRFKRIV